MKDWNVLNGLDSEEAIIGFLTSAFETPDDKDHIKDAIAIAAKAIEVYGLKMTPSPSCPFAASL